MAGEVGDFLEDVRPLMGTYRSIDVRVVARSSGDGSGRALRLRACLSPDDDMGTVPSLPNIPDLLVLQERRPATDLGSLLHGLETGDVEIAGHTIHVAADAGNETWRPLSYYGRTYDRKAALGEFQLDRQTVVLQGYGSIPNTHEWYRERDKLNAALRHADPPWDGLPELYRAFVGEQAPQSDLNNRLAWMIAPLPLRFKDVRMEARLTVEVECFPTIDSGEASLAILFSVGGTTWERRRLRLIDAVRSRNDVYRFDVELPNVFSGIVCALTYRGLDADRRDVWKRGQMDSSVSWSVLAPIVGTPEGFFRDLTNKSGDPLEHSIGVLFHLLGFSVVHPGRGDAPDLFAYTPTGDLLCVIEVTAGGPAREPDLAATVEKLAIRTREIRQKISGQRVLPILVTPRTQDLITEGARQRAAAESVALITSDELLKLVMISTQSPPPSFVVEVLTRAVPSRYGT